MKPYKLEFELASTPKATNRILYSHWRNVKRNADVWKNLVQWAVKGKQPKSPLKKVKLKLTRYNYRTLDYDGLVASFKPVVDGLVHARVLKDDNWKITGIWEVTQEYRPKGHDGIKVEVFEVIE